MSAWAMAVFFQGMSARETADLTLAMVNSGEQVDLGPIAGRKVDKHSTGGVGDKTTLVLAPLVAAAGVKVAKMSGRGLGHTGGTLDKLESIPGFQVELTRQEFIDNVNSLGMAVVGQSGNLVPADKKLYALRDVTATVNSIPLIASSVMSKKIASGADAIVLDVKVGSGAFMKNPADAHQLAKAMVDIGEHVGRETVALITDMDQPLGLTIGNALEVREAIATLKGEGPQDLMELCLALGSEMLVLAGLVREVQQARQELEKVIESGAALDKFKQFVAAQGGNPRAADEPQLFLPLAACVLAVPASADGYVIGLQAEELGRCAMRLGAGRETKDSVLDLAAGLVLAKKRGDRVKAGEALAYVHAASEEKASAVVDSVRQAYCLGEPKPEPGKIVLDRVRG